MVVLKRGHDDRHAPWGIVEMIKRQSTVEREKIAGSVDDDDDASKSNNETIMRPEDDERRRPPLTTTR